MSVNVLERERVEARRVERKPLPRAFNAYWDERAWGSKLKVKQSRSVQTDGGRGYA